MSTSVPPPKLSAWIFYAADFTLLAAAVFVAAQAPRPLPNSAIFGIVACVIAGAILGTIPRLVEYEREKNAALDERQSALEALSHTVANSADQISAATGGLHSVVELANKSLRHAEQLPHKLQEKIAEFQAQLANASDTEKEELEKELAVLRSSETERLESISDRIAKSIAEWVQLENRQQQISPHRPAAPAVSIPASNPRAPEQPLLRGKSASVLPGGATTLSSVAGALPEEPAPLQSAEITPVVPDTHSPYPDAPVEKKNPGSTNAPAGGEPLPHPKQIRKRAGKISASSPPENLLRLEGLQNPEDYSATERESGKKTPQVFPEEIRSALPELTSDGTSGIVVTAYIGIGNRLYIRGDGPRLSWDKGTPLEFVSIGKWRWSMDDVSTPVKFKIYKNDDIECSSLGLQSLPPGRQIELNAVF